MAHVHIIENPRALISGVCKRHSEVPEIQFILEDIDGVVITEVARGCANYTFRVQSQDLHQSVIIKHGSSKDNVRVRRRQIEYEMMKIFDSIRPGSSPKPYCLDMESNVIIMEDLREMTLLSSALCSFKTDETCMRRWAETISTLHWSTHRKNMSHQAWKDMYKIFGASEPKGLIMDWHLVQPLGPEDESMNLAGDAKVAHEELIGDPELLAKYAELRRIVDNEQCLIHADNHSGNLFYNDSRCVFIDAELTGLSVPEFNVAQVAPPFILGLHTASPSKEKETIRQKFISATKVFLDTYIDRIPDMKNEDYKQKFLSLTSAFCAAVCFRLIALDDTRPLWPATPKEVARIMRHMTAILRRASTIKTVDTYLDAFFSDLL